MIRYCTICATPIADARRLNCSTPYCSRECKVANDRERRELLREGRCEACGRKKRKRAGEPVPNAAGGTAAAAMKRYLEMRPCSEEGQS